MDEMEEVEIEKSLEETSKPTVNIKTASQIYVLLFVIMSVILFGIWLTRPDKYFTYSVFKDIKDFKLRSFNFNFSVVNRDVQKSPTNLTLSIHFANRNVMSKLKNASFIYSSNLTIRNKTNIIETIETPPSLEVLPFKQRSIMTEQHIFGSFTNLKFENISGTVTIHTNNEILTTAAINANQEHTYDNRFAFLFKNVFLGELVFLIVFTIGTMQKTKLLYGLEITLALILLFFDRIQYFNEISSSLFATILFVALLYNGTLNTTQIIAVISLICSCFATNFLSQEQNILVAVVYGAITFSIIFVFNTPSSASYIAFFLGIFAIFPNPLLRIGICTICVSIFFFMVSDNYWITVLCLLIIPIPFVITPFDPLRMKAQITPFYMERTYNYSNSFGLTPSNIFFDEANISHALIVSDFFPHQIVESTIEKIANISGNSYIIIFSDAKGLKSSRKVAVLDPGMNLGYTSNNLVADFLESNKVFFDKVAVFKSSAIPDSNPLDLFNDEPLVTGEKFVGGQPSYVENHFKCLIVNGKEKCNEMKI